MEKARAKIQWFIDNFSGEDEEPTYLFSAN
jgi:hypothetical protein